MVSMKLISFSALVSLCATSPVVEPSAKLLSRTSSPVTLTMYSDGACANSIFSGSVTPGQCVNFGSNRFGSKVVNAVEQDCVVKYWAGADCTGKATTYYIPRNDATYVGFLPIASFCIATGNQGGVFVQTDGAGSAIFNCAKDRA
ncbi:hypothetical protein GQ53DRAFT_870191 [Thozetella sp. PMI_491]|nr:hypothetical protein GQ53DRAFT_870191 [Thozetella sp. PMI_491]